ncbi:type II toxin-antitoxin system RelE/ParE family toxin [Flavobacterium psychroterrae]|uniref:Type II toxin-antitoxin system RelE/ParE family toxin n=1 Tax=Flavobacterium psychroterrae TaxID=2133767 RepID=A0ABS5P993_9FLAO|nr:type II toxin-antitoxin system RelE/ParE family toxin [Flavobacterium psychroterrae]MBS7230883.1 type II toxin-antitoxin system RelE/ParE family toxin [Flavobacterium psychroterrae]
MEKEIIWSITAQNQLEKIYFSLLKESKTEHIPIKVINEITNSVTILIKNWEIYEVDEMKILNNGTYRAFQIYNYRISYRITSNTIRILRIRHTSRNPKAL